MSGEKDPTTAKINAILSVKDNEEEITKARALVNELFREKATRQRGLLLSIAEQKIQTLSRISNIADKVTTSIEEDIGEGELEFYSFDEKVKLMADLVRSGAIISSSTELVKNIADTLNDFKNNIELRGGLSEESVAKVELLLAEIRSGLD